MPFVSETISNQVNKLNTKQNETKVIKRKTETAIIKHTTPTADTKKLNILTWDTSHKIYPELATSKWITKQAIKDN